MQEKEGRRKRGMKKIRDEGKEIQDWNDSGLDGYGKEGIQERWNEGQAGRRTVGYRMQECRKGGIQERRDAWVQESTVWVQERRHSRDEDANLVLKPCNGII